VNRARRLYEDRVTFYCPGCKQYHQISDAPGGWTFNGDFEKPTISPSILVNGSGACPSVPRCHSFVREGMIQFLSDCTHELAGQTVELTNADE
jgi:hypothetical protein